MEPETLITLNCDVFDDPTAFPYRDLQKLCKRLEIGGKGRREDLVEKLKVRLQHRAQRCLTPYNKFVLSGTTLDVAPVPVSSEVFPPLARGCSCKPR